MRALTLMAATLWGCGGDTPLAPAALEWQAEPLDFGEVALGEIGEQIVTLQNTGEQAATLLSATIVAGDRRRWAVDRPDDTTIAGGGDVQLVVSFRPRSDEDREAGQLQLRTTAPGAELITLQLLGRGAPSNADDDGDGYSVAQGDCDDQDPTVHPGAPELCDGVDNNCDDALGEGEVDADGDGVLVCAGDCDDSNATVYPGAPTTCEGIDNDCDNVVVDFADQDGDGVALCDAPADCDDLDPWVSPARDEVCDDGRDNDCDGTVDWIDADGDAHNACGPAPDCDDDDAAVFPVVVGPNGALEAAGTLAEPLGSLQAALDGLLDSCPDVYLLPGDHPGAVGTGGGRIRGLGASPADTRVLGSAGVRALDLSGGVWTLRDLEVADGQADTDGGGVRVVGGELVLRDVRVVDNSAAGDGGGVAAVGADLVLVGANHFEGNQAGGAGGGASVDTALLVDVGGTTWLSNDAAVAGGAVAAGGVARIQDAWFEDNQAAVGGAVALTAGEGHLIQRGVFWFNQASADGGALHVDGVGYATVRSVVLSHNTSTRGGGAYLGAGAGAFVNNTLVANVGTEGAAVFHDGEGHVVRANLAHFSDGPAMHTTVAAPIASHNTAFASAGADWVGAWQAGTDDNRSENPGFVTYTDDGDPSDDDLTLSPTSPSRDSGPDEPAFVDTDGTRNDRGHTGGPGAL